MRTALVLALVVGGCAARAPFSTSKQARRVEPPAEMTRCDADAECVVRAASCCECGARSWTAVRRDQLDAYRALVCGRGTSCPACVGNPPEDLRAVCVEHRCATARGQ